MSLRVVIADDHPIVLSGLQGILQNTSGYALVASCNNGADALQAIRAERPDIGVLDINMPALTGLEILETVAREELPTRIILLTATLRDQHVKRAVRNGVCGIVLKEMASSELLQCLRAVSQGNRWLPADLVTPALDRAGQTESDFAALTGSLTERQRELITLVARGLSNKHIARATSISEGTVKMHLYKIYRKLGVENRLQINRGWAAHAANSMEQP